MGLAAEPYLARGVKASGVPPSVGWGQASGGTQFRMVLTMIGRGSGVLAQSWKHLVRGLGFVAGLLALTVAASAGPAGATTTSCLTAGSTGLTAAVVASSNQTITGVINATGCDNGVYIGPGVSGVTVNGAYITGANNHGIFVQNATNDTIENSVVEGNGVAPTVCPLPPKQATAPCIHEDKAIELVGSSYITVSGNTVNGNLADGGIGVADDGPLDPGALQAGTLAVAYHNLIKNNVIVGNSGGCGIVVAAYNAGAGVSNNVIEDNVVAQNPAGIIIAADSPHTLALNNDVFSNVAEMNYLPGIIVHANTPGDVVLGTLVENNALIGNGPDAQAAGGKGPTTSTGIVVIAEPIPAGFPPGLPAATIHWTTLTGNTFSGEATTIFLSHAVTTFR